METTPRNFIMYAVLYGKKGSSATYDSREDMLIQTFALRGNIWNTEDERFLYKKCVVRFTKDRIEENAQKSSCGNLCIHKGVESGVDFEGPPIIFSVYVGEKEFAAIARVCDDSLDQGQMVSASFTIYYPDHVKSIKNHDNYELDVSTTKEYHLVKFDVTCGEQYTPEVVKSPNQALSPTTSIMVLIDDISTFVRFPGCRFDKYSLSGRTSKVGTIPPGIFCGIDFEEYEVDSFGEYPDKDYAGRFYYYPPNKELDSDETTISLTLKYRKVDFANFLKWIILSPANIIIGFRINIGKEQLSSKQQIETDVIDYNIETIQRFGAT